MHGTLRKLSAVGMGLEGSGYVMSWPGLRTHLRVCTPTGGQKWVTLGLYLSVAGGKLLGVEVERHGGEEHRLRGKTDLEQGLALPLCQVDDLAEPYILSGIAEKILICT